MNTATLFGIPVVESPTLPIVPSPGEYARRMVRHGFNDAGLLPASIELGPPPDYATRALLVNGRLHVDGKLLASILARVGADPVLEQPVPGVLELLGSGGMSYAELTLTDEGIDLS